MQSGIFEKEYIAFLEGNLNSASGTINAPIARKENSIIERCINENGERAITHYKLIENKSNFCIVNFKLETRQNTPNQSSFFPHRTSNTRRYPIRLPFSPNPTSSPARI